MLNKKIPTIIPIGKEVTPEVNSIYCSSINCHSRGDLMNCDMHGVYKSATPSSDQVNSVSKKSDSLKESFLDVIHNILDAETRVNGGIFVPVMRALLNKCDVLGWEETEENTFKLTLDFAYEAVDEKSWLFKGKTFILEEKIIMKFDPENFEITFPKVKEIYDASKGKHVKLEDALIQNKNLNSFWGIDSFGGVEYTGVAYCIRWDRSEKPKTCPDDEVLITDNINDAPESIQWMATPRTKTVKESIEEWNNRSRNPIIL